MAVDAMAGAVPDDWEAQKGRIRAFMAQGQPIEAMKLIMHEMRAFSTQFSVHTLGIDTSSYYTNPSAFGRALKALGSMDHAVAKFAGVLAERGAVFLSLAQPSRALQDLDVAAEMHDRHDATIRAALETARAQVALALETERRAEAARKVPVTVLTGFLGAGKTTLLNYILRAHHGKRYAVIENEVGQIGIDNQLIDSSGMATRTEETVTLLDNGCLCCTVRSDLIPAVTQILDRAQALAANRLAAGGEQPAQGADEPPLDAILIETTGLADPGPVCKTFYAEEQLRIRTRLDGVLTVVDAKHFLGQLQRKRSDGAVNESAQQVAFADKLLLNKVDVVDAAGLELVERELRSINEACPVIRCSLAARPQELPLDELFGVESFSLDRVLRDLAGEPEAGAPEPAAKRRRGPALMCREWRPPSRHDTGVATCSFTLEGAPLVLERFTQVMNTIRAERAVDLYRYKGTVCVKEPGGTWKLAVLQGVHDLCQFEPRGRWPANSPPRSQLVFIGRNLDEALWGRLFEKTKEGALDDA